MSTEFMTEDDSDFVHIDGVKYSGDVHGCVMTRTVQLGAPQFLCESERVMRGRARAYYCIFIHARET